MKQFGGAVLFLDRSDINTDEIIPAKYLTENTKQALKPYLLEDLKLEGFDSKKDIVGKKVIITRENFGCGSSREHAPWALEVNGIYVVVATNFARIFRQNMYNCAPKEYIISMRINYAERLLRSGQISVSEVASLCGYFEACYFSRDFRRRVGASPSKYQKQHSAK